MDRAFNTFGRFIKKLHPLAKYTEIYIDYVLNIYIILILKKIYLSAIIYKVAIL